MAGGVAGARASRTIIKTHLQKIIIIGRGQVGSALASGLKGFEIVQWTSDIADLSSQSLAELMPYAVINAAGRTDLAWCEANAREAVRSNVEAPVELYGRLLAHNLKHKATVRFLHLSSGCIWDGPFDEKGEPFTPTRPASPACLYSWTKAASDALLLQRDSTMVAVLRPRQVFSELVSPRNTLSKLLRYPGLIDTPNSMSSAAIIIKTVETLLNAEEDWNGIWNIYDKGYTTPFHVGEMLASAGLRDAPQRITKSALDTWHVPKRVDAVLYDERFERIMQPNSVEEELGKAIAQYKIMLNKQPITA